MRSPWFVADFDSSTALLRALAASLRGRRFRRLGRGVLPGTLTTASSALPEPFVTRAFAHAGALEAIPAARFNQISPDEFAAWAAASYPEQPTRAIAIGSSDGALTHLFAAARIPWLPQTFLVPTRRRADPDDVDADVMLGRRLAPSLLAARPNVAVHQVHDANQDRLMVQRMAYFRLKMLRLPTAYRDYIARVLPTGGTLIVVDDEIRWPVSRLGDRHFFQAGAVGGLRPQEYVAGSHRVSAFLEQQRSAYERWNFPPIDCEAPEAEWGFAPELADDVWQLAERGGYRVVRLGFSKPGAASAHVADIFAAWFGKLGAPTRRLLVETFICVEPLWALRARAAPYWTPFPVEDAAAAVDRYTATRPAWDEIAVTLFAHGVRSAGLAAATQWQALADRAATGRLVGVDVKRWPVDFAALARYSKALDGIAAADQPTPALSLEELRELAEQVGNGDGATPVVWKQLR